ncbi:MAG: PhnD/SsuA/transferrin family substrate-binding protein [Hyphomicrobiales bacterium]|nr:PhnD/SsuA/transferrin family substrate-binding protein [Hyphomicrobiales bacterium]
MSAIAHLPMYDIAEVRPAVADLWKAIAGKLRVSGLADVPVGLAHHLSHHESWCSPELLLGQSCGYPALHEFRGLLRIFATPVYNAPGCEGTTHRSFVVVPANAPFKEIAELRGSRFALNSWDSNTGMNLPRLAFAPFAQNGRFLGEIVETGSHAGSLGCVAEGRADAAAIDCVTHALLERHRPEVVAKTRILAVTAPSPALPFVTTRNASESTVKVLRQALTEALTDPASEPARTALFLKGAVAAEEGSYRVLLDYEEKARQFGYARLA